MKRSTNSSSVKRKRIERASIQSFQRLVDRLGIAALAVHQDQLHLLVIPLLKKHVAAHREVAADLAGLQRQSADLLIRLLVRFRYARSNTAQPGFTAADCRSETRPACTAVNQRTRDRAESCPDSCTECAADRTARQRGFQLTRVAGLTGSFSGRKGSNPIPCTVDREDLARHDGPWRISAISDRHIDRLHIAHRIAALHRDRHLTSVRRRDDLWRFFDWSARNPASAEADYGEKSTF